MNGNGFDPDKLRDIVTRIDFLQREIESERGASMARCKTLREDIGEIFEEAKSAGIPTKPLRVELKARALERKAATMRDDLDEEDFESLEHIALALGGLADLPLGAAALDRVKPSVANAAVADDLLRQMGDGDEFEDERAA